MGERPEGVCTFREPGEFAPKINREVVWQEPRIFDVDFKLISCSRNMYVIVYPV